MTALAPRNAERLAALTLAVVLASTPAGAAQPPEETVTEELIRLLAERMALPLLGLVAVGVSIAFPAGDAASDRVAR